MEIEPSSSTANPQDTAPAAHRRSGSIRRTLLVAFLGVGIVSSASLAALAFARARQALAGEIERSLATQARSLSAELDKMMFERLQNAAIWSRLDIMQDMQVQDVDKRLSQFLTDLRTGYGNVYLNLSCVDDDGQVVSSSDAGLVGTRIASSKPGLQARIANATMELELGTDAASIVSVPVEGTFRKGALGRLRLQLDWKRFEDVLDDAAASDGRVVAVFAPDGRLVAASRGLRSRSVDVVVNFAGWRDVPEAVSIRPGAPMVESDVIVGKSSSRGYERFAGFGWTTLVIQPVDVAFAPVRRMAFNFIALLGLILAGTVVVAIAVSRRLSAPIVRLTDYARAHVRQQAPTTPPDIDEGSGEVGELSEAFVKMVDDIALSQRRLVHASKLAVVGEMSAVIAHEVRTPLGILKSSAQMLRRETGLSEDGRELLGFVESETDRLNRLVSAMLDTVRPRSAAPEPIDMNESARQCIGMLAGQAAGKEVSMQLMAHATDAVVVVDREQITQVLLNILMNALQMLKPGGRIEATTRDDAAFVVVEIADDGPGIAQADQERIFDAFFFRRDGGIGLGLAIVRDIVAAHGGTITAGASPQGGALFRIRLPRSPN